LGDHVWLPEESLLDEMVADDGRLNSVVDSLRNFSTFLDAMASIGEDFWLNDWDKSSVLADGSVSSKRVGCLSDSLFRWTSGLFIDLDYSSPFCESDSHSIVFSSSFVHTVKTHGGSLIFSSLDGGHSNINLDSWDDVLLSKKLDKPFA